MEEILHIIIETLVESLKMLPFLFISYLIIEWVEHKSSEKLKKILSKSGKYGPVAASALGLVPQCGFSVTASNLYSGRVITLGTLIAVFLATSDEAIPVLLSHSDRIGEIIKLLGVKFVFAFIAGMFIDFVIKKVKNKKKSKNDAENEIVQEAHTHMHEVCAHCHCEEKGILKPALKHTLGIFVFIFIVSFLLHIGIHMIGEESLSKLLMQGSIFQPFIAALIGLIPNCVSSVLLTELYLAGNISFGAVIAGLSTGAGLGLAVLFKSNHNQKENIKILGLLYGLGAIGGLIIQIIESVI